jgi:dCTP deaminase
MTILNDGSMRAAIEAGRITIRPFIPESIQPASYDLRLGPVLKIAGVAGFRTHHLLDDGPFWLSQFTFLLASTLEWIEVPDDLSAILAGKSTRAREGIVLENAGYVDPNWRGELTLELFHFSPRPVLLRHGMPIGQIRFEMMTGRCERPYGSDGLGSHYQNSKGPVEARP